MLSMHLSADYERKADGHCERTECGLRLHLGASTSTLSFARVTCEECIKSQRYLNWLLEYELVR